VRAIDYSHAADGQFRQPSSLEQSLNLQFRFSVRDDWTARPVLVGLAGNVAIDFGCIAITSALCVPWRAAGLEGRTFLGPFGFAALAFGLAAPSDGVAGAPAGLPALAPLLAVGALFLWLAPFFEEALSGATVAPCAATAVAVSVLAVAAFSVVIFV
jgi:hypothetical protein